jgi:hypothetical protein
MNCKHFERNLALAAADCLEPAELEQVREHCRRCASCASRLQELERLVLEQRRTADEVAQTPLTFQSADSALVNDSKLRARAAGDAGGRLSPWLLPIAATLAIVLLALIWPREPAETRSALRQGEPVPSPITTTASADSSEPNLATYRSALDNPGEASLDALLARHERHLLPQVAHSELRELRREL